MIYRKLLGPKRDASVSNIERTFSNVHIHTNLHKFKHTCKGSSNIPWAWILDQKARRSNTKTSTPTVNKQAKTITYVHDACHPHWLSPLPILFPPLLVTRYTSLCYPEIQTTNKLTRRPCPWLHRMNSWPILWPSLSVSFILCLHSTHTPCQQGCHIVRITTPRVVIHSHSNH